MTFGSLFAGIGGFDLGLERAGMKPKWQVEYDEYCSRVLAQHWPGVRRFRDIRDVNPADLTSVDVVCGGFPCQPASVAGKRRGQKDDRWLWPEMLRIVQAIRPAWVLGENVAGIISLGLDGVLSDLEGAGYACQTFIIPACAVDAPHRRDRVWIVAHSQRNGRGGGSDGDEARSGRPLQVAGPCAANKSTVLAHAPRQLSHGSGDARARWRAEYPDGYTALAHSNSERQPQPQGREPESGGWIGNSGKDVPDASQPGLSQPERHAVLGEGRRKEGGAASEFCWWPTEPGVGRVAHGIPRRVDRLRALGNAVVPSVVERIGKAIMEISK